MFVALMGLPGAGKSTVTKHVKDFFGCTSITPGDLARERAKSDREFAAAMEAGAMAPREAMNNLMAEYLQALSSQELVLLDGFPRYEDQRKLLEPYSVLYAFLRIGDEAARVRLMNRERGDDSPEIIASRISGFYNETWPVVQDLHRLAVPASIPSRNRKSFVMIEASFSSLRVASILNLWIAERLERGY